LQVSNISTYGTYKQGEERIPKKELDKEAFLQLLVTQMRYQNPLEPLGDTEFIAQMAQFSSLEQLQNMNSTLSNLTEVFAEMLINQREMTSSVLFSEATSMVGKEVLAVNPETEQEFQGIVTKALLIKGIPYVEIAGNLVPTAYVLSVGQYSGGDNPTEEGVVEDDPED